MRPFSPLKYFFENKKRTTIVLVTLMLSVAVVSFLTSLVESIIVDATMANMEPFKTHSVIARTSNDIFLKDTVIDRVKVFPEVKELIPFVSQTTSYSSLIGGTSSQVYFFDNEKNIAKALELNDLTLTAGRLPAVDKHEIAMHERLLKNKKLQIGDYVGEDVQEDEWLRGKYKIVGSLTGDSIISLGGRDLYSASLEKAGVAIDKPFALLVIPKAGQLAALNTKLDTIERTEGAITTYSGLERMIEDDIASLKVMLFIIIFIIVLVLSISMGALIYIVYMGRTDEFGILHAIGYRKGFISQLIFKELACLSASAWGIGYLFSMALTWFVNTNILAAKGQALHFFSRSGVTNTLFIPLMVLICASFPILRRFSRWDAIAVIERRD